MDEEHYRDDKPQLQTHFLAQRVKLCTRIREHREIFETVPFSKPGIRLEIRLGNQIAYATIRIGIRRFQIFTQPCFLISGYTD